MLILGSASLVARASSDPAGFGVSVTGWVKFDHKTNYILITVFDKANMVCITKLRMSQAVPGRTV